MYLYNTQNYNSKLPLSQRFWQIVCWERTVFVRSTYLYIIYTSCILIILYHTFFIIDFSLWIQCTLSLPFVYTNLHCTLYIVHTSIRSNLWTLDLTKCIANFSLTDAVYILICYLILFIFFFTNLYLLFETTEHHLGHFYIEPICIGVYLKVRKKQLFLKFQFFVVEESINTLFIKILIKAYVLNGDSS